MSGSVPKWVCNSVFTFEVMSLSLYRTLGRVGVTDSAHPQSSRPFGQWIAQCGSSMEIWELKFGGVVRYS